MAPKLKTRCHNPRMIAAEIAIWSVMAGCALSLLMVGLIDLVVNQRVDAWRNVGFVSVMGLSSVVLSGLPEALFPNMANATTDLVKLSVGPVAGALALYFLGMWLGGRRQDAWVRRLTAWGGAAALAAALALTAVGLSANQQRLLDLLWVAAGINMLTWMSAMVVVVRSAALGDPLARWMLLAIGLLGFMVLGLYARALRLPELGIWVWVATATSAVLFFVLSFTLVWMRNRQARVLARLMRLEQGADTATGLVSGAALIGQIEHALWRAARRGKRCTVICLYVDNLYGLAAVAGPGVDQQILVATAARIRRTVGFRCLVGSYHPRCFVVVMSNSQVPDVDGVLRGLRMHVGRAISVTGDVGVQHLFVPELGLGVVTVEANDAQPLDLLNQAERLAQASLIHATSASSAQGPAPAGVQPVAL